MAVVALRRPRAVQARNVRRSSRGTRQPVRCAATARRGQAQRACPHPPHHLDTLIHRRETAIYIRETDSYVSEIDSYCREMTTYIREIGRYLAVIEACRSEMTLYSREIAADRPEIVPDEREMNAVKLAKAVNPLP